MDKETFDQLIDIITTHDEGEGQYCDTGDDMRWHCRSECTKLAVSRLKNAFTAFEVRSEGGWISTKDRMPEIHEHVFLKANRYWRTPGGVPDMKVTATGYLDDLAGLYWYVFGERPLNIDAFTHWMPVPCDD